MIRSDIATKLMDALPGLTRQKANKVVDLLVSHMNQALLDGRRIELRGFGIFKPRPRKSGNARVIRTGVTVPIPKGRSIRFKPGKELRGLAPENDPAPASASA